MTDKSKRVIGLVCLLANIILPWAVGLMVVGLGRIVYGAVQSERGFLRNGITQLVLSFSSVGLAVCSVVLFYFGLLSIQALPQDSLLIILFVLLAFPLVCPGVPLGMYIWSVVDAVKLYRHSQESL